MKPNILINKFPVTDKEKKEYDEWLTYEFKERTFQDVSLDINTDMCEFFKDHLQFDKGYMYRERAPQILNSSNIFEGTNCIVTTFKIRQMTKETQFDNDAIYAFLYTKIIDKEVVPSYYCTGPSLVSRDGEYRQRVGLYMQINRVKKKHKSLFAAVEKYLLRKSKLLRWNYYDEHFYPNKQKKRFEPQLISFINRSRIKLDLLVCSWFATLFNVANNIIENHINKLYLSILGFDDKKMIADDKKFYLSLINEYGYDEVCNMRKNLNIFNTQQMPGLKLGQKLTPLNIAEVENPLNIKYKPWREFLISKKLQDLIINGICRGFPYVGEFYYLKNINKTMFDNYVQFLKIEHSEQALHIVRKLIEARRATYYTAEEFQSSIQRKNRKQKNLKIKSSINKTIETDLDDKDKRIRELYKLEKKSTSKSKSLASSGESLDDVSMWMSQKFKKLYEMIDDPINYGKASLIMSEVAFGTISEFVGRTWYDFLLLNSDAPGKSGASKYYSDETGNALSVREKSSNFWFKYIFEYVYALLSINIHMGLIHGDFHLNNGTIHPIYYNDYFNLKEKVKKDGYTAYMAYVLPSGDNKVSYIFESLQYHSCLIDFSRSIIRPSFIEKYKDEQYYNNKKYKINFLKKKDRVKFHNTQVTRILYMYNTMFPDMYTKNKNNIDLFINAYIEKLFPLLTAFDMYKFAKETMIFFKVKLKNRLASKQYQLIKKIKKITEHFLTIRLQKIMDNPTLLDDPYYSDTYANREIIDECFSDFLLMTTYHDEWVSSDMKKKLEDKKSILMDVCFLDNKVKYSMFSDTRKRPEYLKHIYLRKGNTNVMYTKDKKCSALINKNNTRVIDNNLSMLTLIARRHIEKYL